MLVYSPESKEMIYEMLTEASGWGKYSAHFISELHKKLSTTHLRDDVIHITYVDFKIIPVPSENEVKFQCEISLMWDSGMVGGLVWHEFNHTFGIHS